MEIEKERTVFRDSKKAKLTSIEWERIVYLVESNENTCAGPLYCISTIKSWLFCFCSYEMAKDITQRVHPKERRQERRSKDKWN